jgi:hypothetical protein
MGERNHLGESGVDGRIINTTADLQKVGYGVWTGLGWLGIETGGGHL